MHIRPYIHLKKLIAPVGLTRFERTMKIVLLAGSAQAAMPVNPVCPKVSGEHSQQDKAEAWLHCLYMVCQIQAPYGWYRCCRLWAHNSSVWQITLPIHYPFVQEHLHDHCNIIRVTEQPAWPATPPNMAAPSSCTSPRSNCSWNICLPLWNYPVCRKFIRGL